MSAPLRGSGRPRRGRGGISAVAPAPSARDLDSEDTEEVRALRAKFGAKLATAKELFPDWTDEDILSALQEANGDLEVCIVRMSEGLATQWAVKTKKEKKLEKPAAAPAVPVALAAQRGGFAGASRGRGGFEGARGGRGGARGGRGGRGGAVGVNGVPRPPAAPQANGASSTDVNSVTPASFVPAPTPTAIWGKPVADATSSDPTASSTPASWADQTAAASTTPEAAPAPAAEEAAPQVNGAREAASPQAEAPKPAPRIIAPGSTRSWAQIARPVSPPKPAPAPIPIATPSAPAPAPAAPVPAPAAVEAAPEPVTAPAAPPAVEETAAPTINLPSAAPTETAAPAQPAYDPWGSTPAAAPSPAPLAVGEGWADSIVASKATTEQDAAFKREVEAHLPPNDIATAGPIDVTASAAPAAQAQPQAAAPAQQSAQDKFLGAGPPGLPPKRLQQEAVVLPGQASAVDRVGLQFGSLDLLDSAKQEAQLEQAAPQATEAPAAYQQQVPQGIQQHQQQQVQPQQVQPQAHLPQQHYQQAYQQPSQQEQAVQTAFSQAPAAQSNPFPGQASSAFSQRYPTMPSPYQQFQQQQPADEQSAYAAFKPAEAVTPAQQAVSSPYFQQPASHSPAPAAAALQQQQQQQQIQSPYAAFNSIPQQQAPGQPFGSQQTDYSSLYGQDSMRSMGFYDAYGQFANQAPSPLPTRPEDSSSSAQASQASAAPGGAQGQQQQQPPAQHSFYGGMPYYNPYQGYGYGYQVPPNYAALQSQFYGNYQPQQPQRFAGNAPQQQPQQPQPGAAGSPAVAAQQQPGQQGQQGQQPGAFGGNARYGAQAYGAPGAGVQQQQQQLYGTSYGKDVTQDSSRFFGGH